MTTIESDYNCIAIVSDPLAIRTAHERNWTSIRFRNNDVSIHADHVEDVVLLTNEDQFTRLSSSAFVLDHSSSCSIGRIRVVSRN